MYRLYQLNKKTAYGKSIYVHFDHFVFFEYFAVDYLLHDMANDGKTKVCSDVFVVFFSFDRSLGQRLI